MSLRAPWMLVALVGVPLLVAAYIAAGKVRQRRAAALVANGLGPAPEELRRPRRFHLPFVLVVVALIVLVVGLSRPTATIRTPRREGTVIVAVDVSNSMAAADIKPTRFAAAKGAAEAFVRRQVPAVRVGVVAFGNGAVAVQTPTTAHADAITAIEHLSLGGGTSVGQAILTSLDTIAGKQLTIDESQLATDAGSLDIGY